MLFVYCMIICSCSDSVNLNKAIYRKAFLWSEAETILSKNVVVLDWNKDAIDSNAKATFLLVDENMQPLPDYYIVGIDGKEIPDNRFIVNSDIKEIELCLGCKPGTNEGRKDGYLLLESSHTLDRINDVNVVRGQAPQDYIFHWSFKYDEQMNNIVFFFWTLILTICALLLIWFIILKPILSPTFGKFSKAFTVLENNMIVLSQRRINLKGYKEFHLTPKKTITKQSVMSRIFTGRIGYLVVPQLKSDVILKPKALDNKCCYVGGSYNIPSPILHKNGNLSIQDRRNKIEIKIN